MKQFDSARSLNDKSKNHKKTKPCKPTKSFPPTHPRSKVRNATSHRSSPAMSTTYGHSTSPAFSSTILVTARQVCPVFFTSNVEVIVSPAVTLPCAPAPPAVPVLTETVFEGEFNAADGDRTCECDIHGRHKRHGFRSRVRRIRSVENSCKVAKQDYSVRRCPCRYILLLTVTFEVQAPTNYFDLLEQTSNTATRLTDDQR